MTDPGLSDIYEAIDVTWPPASRHRLGPWMIRDGQGGGSRVSATTAQEAFHVDDIHDAERAMDDLGQTPLFMIRQGEEALDAALEAAGYVIKDPVTVYRAPVSALTTEPLQPVTTFRHWPPLAIARDIWSEAAIGPARLAIMHRCTTEKTVLLGRVDDSPAAVCFVARSGPHVMLHALEVRPRHRRKALGKRMVVAAAHWAAEAGSTHLVLLVTTANTAANALYRALGMQPVGRYHYRLGPSK